MKSKFCNISGLSLVEVLIGIVISSIMMAAIYTTYTVVNNSYAQVTGRASVSASGRDVASMLIRELRMAGFRYYGDTLYFDDGRGVEGEDNNHYPIIIKDSIDQCCDRIEIVYGDYDQTRAGTDGDPKFLLYKVIYFAALVDDYYNLYKVKLRWNNPAEKWFYVFGGESGVEYPDNPITTRDAELLRKYLVDMEFVPIDKNGQVIPTSLTVSSNADRLNDIKTVDVKITFRSKDDFFKKIGTRNKIEGLRKNERDIAQVDKFLRDSVILSVHTRNIGN